MSERLPTTVSLKATAVLRFEGKEGRRASDLRSLVLVGVDVRKWSETKAQMMWMTETADWWEIWGRLVR